MRKKVSAMLIMLAASLFYGCSNNDDVYNINDRYSEKVRHYFVACAFDQQVKNTSKWGLNQISYSISGFSRKHQTFINASFAELGRLRNLPTFKLVQANADIEITMPETEDLFALQHGLKQDLRGYTDFKKDELGFFTKVKVGINPVQSDQNIQISIHHELMHAMGFLAHPSFEPKESSVFGTRYFGKMDPLDRISPRFPQIDQRVLELLYEDDLRVGMGKAEVQDLFDREG